MDCRSCCLPAPRRSRPPTAAGSTTQGDRKHQTSPLSGSAPPVGQFKHSARRQILLPECSRIRILSFFRFQNVTFYGFLKWRVEKS